ncbi:hypothetical protein [Trinickia sp.]|uniref:hypothetical protein n=1 Tax=Trinickia sp. TaxID=2571163 RepID=UPI003F8195B5
MTYDSHPHLMSGDETAPAATSFKRYAKKTVDAMQEVLHNLVSLLLTQQRKTGGARGEVALVLLAVKRRDL